MSLLFDKHALVFIIVVSLFAWGFSIRERVLRKYFQWIMLGVLLFTIILLGADLLRETNEKREAWRAGQLSRESYHEKRRCRYRKHPEPWRGFLGPQTSSCPTKLVRKRDGKFYLYDTSLPDTVITNPIVFKTISEYIAYWKQQRAAGSNCPVAYLQEESTPDPSYFEISLEAELKDAQAMDRAAHLERYFLPVDTQRGDREPVPHSNSNEKPFLSQDQGVWTQANEKALRPQIGGYKVPMDQSASGIGVGIPGVSANPMDPNWGGARYSQILREEGYFRHGGKANL